MKSREGGYPCSWCSHRTWWIIPVASANSVLADFFVSGSYAQVTSSWSEAPGECCWHLHPPASDMIPQLHVFSLAFKRKPLARGTRAPHVSSIVDGFCRLPSPVSGADSVGPAACPLARAAARGLLAWIREDGQNGSRHATTPDGRAGMEIAEPWPGCDELAPLFRAGRSASPAQ